MEGFVQSEEPADRAARHAVEGTLAIATVDRLSKVEKALERVERILCGADSDPEDNGLVGDVKMVKTWLVGKTSATGVTEGGVIRRVDTVFGAWKWAIGLIGILATATVVNTVANIVSASHVTH